jgi:hypothetical protein
MVLDATTPRSPDTPRVEPTSQAGCRSRVRVERLRRGAPAAHKSPRESLTKRRTVGLPSPPSRPRDRRVIRGTPREGSAEKNRRHEVFLVRDVFFGPFGILLDRKNRFSEVFLTQSATSGRPAASLTRSLDATESLLQSPQTLRGHLVRCRRHGGAERAFEKIADCAA